MDPFILHFKVTFYYSGKIGNGFIIIQKTPENKTTTNWRKGMNERPWRSVSYLLSLRGYFNIVI